MVPLPWDIMDLNSGGWTESPMGCLGAWVHLGTWYIWASLMVQTYIRLLSLPPQSSHPMRVLRQGLSILTLLDSPSGGHLERWCFLPGHGSSIAGVCFAGLGSGIWTWDFHAVSGARSFTVHYELLFSQFVSTELQWITKTGITPAGDNHHRALLS